MGKPWTDEETANFRCLVEVEGISFRSAAKMIGREPNSAIAKARREGIKSKHPSGQQPSPTSRRAKRRERALRATLEPAPKKQNYAMPPRPKIAKPSLRVADPFAPLDGVAPIGFDDLQSTSCRWPIQRGTFCGAFAIPHSGPLGACYCPSHAAMARA